MPDHTSLADNSCDYPPTWFAPRLVLLHDRPPYGRGRSSFLSPCGGLSCRRAGAWWWHPSRDQRPHRAPESGQAGPDRPQDHHAHQCAQQNQSQPDQHGQRRFQTGRRNRKLFLLPSLFQLRPHLGHIPRQRLQLGLGGELPHLPSQRPKQGLLCRNAGLQALQPVAVGDLQLV